ncbi:MAG: hypothetical protein GY791_18610 [Alphaproteobacteria bacterium]|nr:hypothetical protein [Alphaproteobacteria bacterium]
MTKSLRAPAGRLIGLACSLFLVAGCAAKTATAPEPTSAAPRITSVPQSFAADRLQGMDSDNLNRLLGTPGLLRRDGPAQIWQYVDQACILDLFLYENGRRHYVEYVEARPSRVDGGVPPTVQSCLDGILSDRRPLTS